MGCHFSAHRCCDLLLISKKPYFKNTHVCQALWKQDLWQFATETHTGTRNHRQQNAFAVVLGRARQVETEGEEGGDKAHAGCCRPLPQSDQSGAGTSRPEQCDISGVQGAPAGTSKRLLKPTKDKRFCPQRVCCLAGPKHKEMLHSQPVSPGHPWLHPQSPRATTMAWARMGDALQADSHRSWRSSSLPSSVPSKTVELSASYN